MDKNSKIYIAGHRGLVGSAILKNLQAKGYTNFVTRSHKELDLTDSKAVAEFFKVEKPEYVVLAAAKVGGIIANNTYRAEFIYDNLMIQNNVIHQSYVHHVKKLLFLGSTCIYPKNAPQPILEDCLLTGELEYTNEPYAIAKIAGIKLCESYNLQYGTNFISVMPTNLYGPNDNFDLEKSHVLPALIRKIHLGKALENNDWETIKKDLDKLPIEGITGNASKEEILKILDKYGIKLFSNPKLVSERHAELDSASADSHVIASEAKQSHNIVPQVQIEIWGTGKPMREFLWSEDMADACIYLMENRDFKDTIIANRQPEPVEGETQQNHGPNAIARAEKQSPKKERHAELVSASHKANVVSSTSTSLSTGFTEIRNTHINIGTGKDISIKDLAELIKKTIGFKGILYFNTSKPDGTLKKLTDPSKLHQLGWSHKIKLEEGIQKMYEWYIN
jgi:GDP-L-fucose synthase